MDKPELTEKQIQTLYHQVMTDDTYWDDMNAAELEKLVDAGKGAVAFSMYPTTLPQLMAIADADAIMPPKSTWFEPKLRDGLVTHNF